MTQKHFDFFNFRLIEVSCIWLSNNPIVPKLVHKMFILISMPHMDSLHNAKIISRIRHLNSYDIHA